MILSIPVTRLPIPKDREPAFGVAIENCLAELIISVGSIFNALHTLNIKTEVRVLIKNPNIVSQ